MIINNNRTYDLRGAFQELYVKSAYRKIGIMENFDQINESISNYGVVRGMHVNVKRPQSKLLRVVYGEIFDVVVDLRPDSKTFRQTETVSMSSDSNDALYIPAGCGHGFLSLKDKTIVQWMSPYEYRPNEEVGIRWDDPTLNIDWPTANNDYIVCERDANLFKMSSPELRASLEALRIE